MAYSELQWLGPTEATGLKGGGGREGEVSLKCNGKNSIIAFVVWRLKNINLVTCKSLTEIQF